MVVVLVVVRTLLEGDRTVAARLTCRMGLPDPGMISLVVSMASVGSENLVPVHPGEQGTLCLSVR